MVFKKREYLSWGRFSRLMNDKAHIMFIHHTCKDSIKNIMDLEARGETYEY